MSPSQQQLELFDQLSFFEGSDVEYKSAAGGVPRSLWETYSAFANTGGGSIWLGVAQKNGRLEAQGIENAERLVGDLWNLVNNPEKISRNLLSNDDIRIVGTPFPGKSLIYMRVPRASRRERPVYVGKDPFSGTFRRNYEGDYRCSDDEVRRMFADQSGDAADSRVLEGFAWEDLHPDSLRQFRNRMAASRPGHPWLGESDQGLLARLGGWRRDRSAQIEGITVAGLLMFGREQAIRDAAAVPQFQLDYRERFSDDPALRWTDRLTLDGTWEGNLFQFFQLVSVKLSVGPGVKQPFQIDSQGVRRAMTPVHEALQEALVNALIHADYSGQGGVVIDRYLDRLEFSNPGTLLLSREQLLRGGISECRNRSLQQMFQMLGAGDKAGSGIDKIRASWAAQHWQSPRLIETYQPDRVKLVLPMVSTLPPEVMEGLDRRFGPAFRERTPDEIQTLVAAEVEGEITNQRLQEMLTLHRVDITQMLRGLVWEGLLLQDGQGRGTRYYPLSRSANSPDSAGSSPDKGASSPDKPAEGIDQDGPEARVPPPPDDHLQAIAEPVRRTGRASPEIVRSTILELCRGRFLSLRELSRLLDRSVGTLRDSYLTPMLKSKHLELRFPDTPNHPEQGYRAAGSATDARGPA